MTDRIELPDNAAEYIAAFLAGARGVKKLRPWEEVADRLLAHIRESWRPVPAEAGDSTAAETLDLDALVWVALDDEDNTPITTPLKSRAEVQAWLNDQYDDVNGHAATITVAEYLASGGYAYQHGAAIARAVEGFVADGTQGGAS
jgi:putative intracellular protease/amidase